MPTLSVSSMPTSKTDAVTNTESVLVPVVTTVEAPTSSKQPHSTTKLSPTSSRIPTRKPEATTTIEETRVPTTTTTARQNVTAAPSTTNAVTTGSYSTSITGVQIFPYVTNITHSTTTVLDVSPNIADAASDYSTALSTVERGKTDTRDGEGVGEFSLLPVVILTPITCIFAFVFICASQLMSKRMARMAQQSDASTATMMTCGTQRSQTDFSNSFPNTHLNSVPSLLPESAEKLPLRCDGNVVTNSEQDSDLPYDYAFPYQHHAISQKIYQQHEGEKVLYEDVDDVQNNTRHDEDQSHLRNQFLCNPTVNPAYGIPKCVA